MLEMHILRSQSRSTAPKLQPWLLAPCVLTSPANDCVAFESLVDLLLINQGLGGGVWDWSLNIPDYSKVLSQLGMISCPTLNPGRRLVMPRDIFGCHKGEGVAGFQWREIKDAVKHCTIIHRTAFHHTVLGGPQLEECRG